MIDDDLDYSISVFKSLRKDLLEVFKSYANFDKEKFKLNLKVLKNSKMILIAECEVDGLIFKSYNLQ